jgi:Uma2 family endonuclease
MVAETVPRYTSQQYLELERAAAFRSEFIAGYIINMAGGSALHDGITINLTALLHGRLRGSPCRPYTANMRMGIREAGAYFYPDLSVVCGEPVFDDEWRDTINNAGIVFEVLSPSTEKYDRGDKSIAYRSLESLREYVLISQEKPHVERYTRQDNGSWLLTEVASLSDTLELPSIDCRIPLSELYEGVEFPPKAPPDMDTSRPR